GGSDSRSSAPGRHRPASAASRSDLPRLEIHSRTPFSSLAIWLTAGLSLPATCITANQSAQQPAFDGGVACCLIETPVERSQWQAPALGKLQIGGVIRRQVVTVGKAQRRVPDVLVRFPVDLDRQIAELDERSLSKPQIYSATPHR